MRDVAIRAGRVGAGRRRTLFGVLLALTLALLLAVGLLTVTTKPAEAAFPGVNGKILFTSDRDKPSMYPWFFAEIYSMNPDGTGETRLTNTMDTWERSPTASPDGSKIAFAGTEKVRIDYSTKYYEDIYAMNADGSGITKLTEGWPTESRFDAPAWSPDGKQLAFLETGLTGSDAGIHIVVMDADGTNQKRIVSGIYNCCYNTHVLSPAWSPDGLKIAFAAPGLDGRMDIHAVNADGSNRTNLTNTTSSELSPDWSPDGTEIVYRRDGSSQYYNYVYTMNADGSNQTKISSLPNDQDPAFSPDGKKITFVDYGGAGPRISTMDADGSNRTRLTEDLTLIDGGPVSDLQPSWGPGPPDTTKPTVSLMAPAENATVSGASVALKAEASDDTGVADVRFYVYKDGAWSLLGTDTTAGGTSGKEYSYTWDSTSLPNGQTWIYADARDAAGNGNYTSSRPITVTNTTADTTKPTVSLTAPTSGATVSGSSVAFKAEASDDKGVADVRFYIWKDGAWSWVGTDTTAGGTSGKEYSYTWDSTSVSDGQNYFYADARDAAGNVTYTNYRTITVENSSSDTEAPTVSSTTPTSSQTGVARNTDLTIAFSEQMDPETLSTSTVQLKQKQWYQIRKKVRGKIRRVWTYRWVPVSASVSYDSTTKTATLDPVSDLVANTNYWATVTTGAKDAAGNTLAQNYSWSFTTGAT